MQLVRYLAIALCVGSFCFARGAKAEEPVITTGKYRVFGMFSPDRQDDLRMVMQKLPDIKLVSIDYDAGEATFEYDIKKVFGTPTAEELPIRFDNQVRGVSNSTFGIKTLCTIPRDKLERIEIPVYGLDCKACSFACYKMLVEVDGVEFCTASFKDQRAVVWIDPSRTNRAALETHMKQREVSLEPAKVIVVP